jgi:hypothetical protein
VEAPTPRPAHLADRECGETGYSADRPRVYEANFSREAESEVGLCVCVCVGRREAARGSASGESPGVERRELDCGRGVRKVGFFFFARSVEVDAERELLDPFGEMERVGGRSGTCGMDCSRRRGASEDGRRQPEGICYDEAGESCVLACVKTTGRVSSFDRMRGCIPVRVMPQICCICSGLTGEVSNGE